MVIQIIPKQQDKSLSLEKILLYFSLILLAVILAGYFILNNFQQKTEKDIQLLDEKLAAADASPEAVLEKEVLSYQKKIDDFSSLLASHKYNSQIFPLIESITHPKVVFSDFSLEAGKSSVVLSGITDSFLSLDQQLTIFKNEKLIKEVRVSNISFEEDGRISFNFDFVLDPQIFIIKTDKNE
ncbi:MAG: hypothetical protein ABIG40_00945 [Parcubacteria group bacterium]